MAKTIGEAGLPVLEKAMKTGDPALQEAAAYWARRMGEAGLTLVENFQKGNIKYDTFRRQAP